MEAKRPAVKGAGSPQANELWPRIPRGPASPAAHLGDTDITSPPGASGWEKKFLRGPRVKVRALMANAGWWQLAGEAWGAHEAGWWELGERLAGAQGTAFEEAPSFQGLPLPAAP